MRKSAVIIIVLILFSAIYYFLNTADENSLVAKTVSAAREVVKKSPFGAENRADTAPAGGPAAPVSEDGTASAPAGLQNLNEMQLRNWVREESRALDSTRNNTGQIQIRLRAQAQTLTPPQLRQLVQSARDSAQGVNPRILSAYLISLNTSPAAVESLYDLARSTPPDHGPSLPHTEAELKNAQELALRYMQIDELAARAPRDSNARNKLNLLAREGGSPQVRSYAQRKLAEIK